jgi:CBS-domain-containing membrane protein
MIRTARKKSNQNPAVTLAEDIMVRRVYTAKPDQMISTVVSLLLRHKISGMPVVDGDQQVIGVISERGCISALMRAVYDRTPPSLVRDVMTPAVTIGPGAHLMTVAHHFSVQNIRRLPVVDDAGCLVGQISRRDLLRAARRIFESSSSRDAAVLYLSALERDAPPLR